MFRFKNSLLYSSVVFIFGYPFESPGLFLKNVAAWVPTQPVKPVLLKGGTWTSLGFFGGAWGEIFAFCFLYGSSDVVPKEPCSSSGVVATQRNCRRLRSRVCVHKSFKGLLCIGPFLAPAGKSLHSLLPECIFLGLGKRFFIEPSQKSEHTTNRTICLIPLLDLT